jgi:hypothetical protein
MAELPEFIYRSGGRIKTLALVRQVDWQTGLSFRSESYSQQYVKLRVKTLVDNGFIVRPDAGKPVKLLWTDELYIEPNSEEPINYDDEHVSVWHPDKQFWDAWYQADLKNKDKEEISTQLGYFALAVVEIVKR